MAADLVLVADSNTPLASEWTLMVRNTFLELVEDEDSDGSKLRKRRMSAPVSSVFCTDRKSQEQGMAELQDRWRMSSRHTESTCSLDGRLGSMSTTDEDPAYEIDMEGETEYSFQPGDPEPHPSSATSLADGHPNVQPTLPAYSLEPLPMLRNEPEVSMAKGSLVMVSVPFVPVGSRTPWPTQGERSMNGTSAGGYAVPAPPEMIAQGAPRRLPEQNLSEPPSAGSVSHPYLCSRVCRFFQQGHCPQGKDCGFCHLPHERYRPPHFDKNNRTIFRDMDERARVQLMWPMLQKKVAELSLGARADRALEEWYASMCAACAEQPGGVQKQRNAIEEKRLRKVMGAMNLFELCVISGRDTRTSRLCENNDKLLRQLREAGRGE